MYVHHLWKINLSEVVTLLIFHFQQQAPGQFLRGKKKNHVGVTSVKASAQSQGNFRTHNSPCLRHANTSSPPILPTHCHKLQWKQAHKKENWVLYFTVLEGEAVWPDVCSWIFRWCCYEYASGCQSCTISTQIYELVKEIMIR